MTVDDSDHEVPGPLRGNRFALLNDHHSEHVVEQVGPDLGGVGRRRRLVLRNRRHGEAASTSHQQDPDLDGLDSVEGASEAVVEDVVEPTVVSPKFPFANLCAFPSLVTVVSGLLLTVCGCGSVLAPAPLTSVSMDVGSRLHPPCRSVMWIPVLPPSIVAPMKWCTDFLVRRTLVLGVWPVGAMILFLKVALHGTWLCHPHGPSVMLHTVTCSIVSRSVPPSQISVNSGVVDVL